MKDPISTIIVLFLGSLVIILVLRHDSELEKNEKLKQKIEQCQENSIYEAKKHLKELEAEKENGYKQGRLSFYYDCLNFIDKELCHKMHQSK